MINPDPTVSVVLSAHNAAPVIGAAICSVLAQTCRDFELIVVDDGSTDATAQKARAFLADPRVHLITRPHIGRAAARNAGLLEARGRLVALMDAHDTWQPAKLARHVAHLDAHPDVGASVDRVGVVNGVGGLMRPRSARRPRRLEAMDLLRRTPIGSISAVVMRRDALAAMAGQPTDRAATEPVGPFDAALRPYEDFEVWMRLALTTPWRFQVLPEVLTYSRIETGGLSAGVAHHVAAWGRTRESLAALAPAFMASHGRLADAFQWRALARLAVHDRDGATAVRMMGRALRLAPLALMAEPLHTGMTLGTALALALAAPARPFVGPPPDQSGPRETGDSPPSPPDLNRTDRLAVGAGV